MRFFFRTLVAIRNTRLLIFFKQLYRIPFDHELFNSRGKKNRGFAKRFFELWFFDCNKISSRRECNASPSKDIMFKWAQYKLKIQSVQKDFKSAHYKSLLIQFNFSKSIEFRYTKHLFGAFLYTERHVRKNWAVKLKEEAN